jgi:hypothetical protein
MQLSSFASSCHTRLITHGLYMCAAFALQYFLPEPVSTSELRDMLLIAVNMPHPRPADALLYFDEQEHKQLLHASSSNTFNSSSCGSTSSSDAAQLVQQLITTAITRRHWDLAPRLAATPAAQQLGLPALTQLLSVCIDVRYAEHVQLTHDFDRYIHDEPRLEAPCFDVLCALPAASGLSASTAASLMRIAVRQQWYELAVRLLALPAAQQLAAPQLFELLLLELQHYRVLQRERASFVEQLTALLLGKQLVPEAARQLLSAGLECGKLTFAMKQAYYLDLESQLTSSDVLQLLQQAAKQGDDDGIFSLARLAAAQEIVDEEGFAAFLQTALDHCIDDSDMTTAVGQLPVLQQLGPDAVLGILQSSLDSFKDNKDEGLVCIRTRSVYSCVADHPAVHSFSTEMLEQLLLKAAQRGCLVESAYQIFP